jgi:hypothetical protein
MLVLVSVVGCNQPPSETIVDVVVVGGGRGGGGGGGSGGGGGAGGGARTSNLDIEGFWATYADMMDGTVVSLHASGNVITGRGCLSGWQEKSQCGDITGTVEGNQVNFEFPFPFGGSVVLYNYGVNVQLVTGGARMNGEQYYYEASLPRPQPGATEAAPHTTPAILFRPPPQSDHDRQWPFDPVPMEAGSALTKMRWVTMLGDAPAGKFTPGTSYELKTDWGGLRGDLGLFAPVDLTYEYPEDGVLVIHAAQVAQLAPDSPVSLEIEVRDTKVVSVEAELATGEMLSFAPVPL